MGWGHVDSWSLQNSAEVPEVVRVIICQHQRPLGYLVSVPAWQNLTTDLFLDLLE